jgi:hypothetical protein
MQEARSPVLENLGKSGSHRTTSINLNLYQMLIVMCCPAQTYGKSTICYNLAINHRTLNFSYNYVFDTT